jgi:hypothetical protein
MDTYGKQESTTACSFHSISFPNEWGASRRATQGIRILLVSVSIQLVSPTSGENQQGDLQ